MKEKVTTFCSSRKKQGYITNDLNRFSLAHVAEWPEFSCSVVAETSVAFNRKKLADNLQAITKLVQDIRCEELSKNFVHSPVAQPGRLRRERGAVELAVRPRRRRPMITQKSSQRAIFSQKCTIPGERVKGPLPYVGHLYK